jgi:hypothetical protein
MTSSKKTQPEAKTPNRKPLADYVDAQVTPLIAEYAAWLTQHTGYEVDPKSVFLSSALRSRFQQERREAKVAPKPVRKRAPRKPAEPKVVN